MAQIRIEKEPKNNSILPWILGLLLLAAGVYVVAEVLDEVDEEILTEAEINDVNERGNRITDEEYDPNEENEGNFLADDVEKDRSSYEAGDRDRMNNDYQTSFNEFMTYTNHMDGEMGLDHEFSHRALSLLATSAASVADSRGVDNDNYEGKANQVMRLADDITKDPYATDHADKIRMAALLITEMLEGVNQDAFDNRSDAEIDLLRKEAQAINSNTLTLNQKEDVRSFFRAARKVLNTMQ